MRLLSASPSRPNEAHVDTDEELERIWRPLHLGEQYLRPGEGTLTRAQYLERAS